MDKQLASMRIKKWLLKHKQWVSRAYTSVFVIGHILMAAMALVWIGALGALVRELPPLNTLPKHIAIYLGLGLGCLAMTMAGIGFVIVCCVLTENWLKWIKRAINKRVRERIWDLEYTVQEAEDKERHKKFKLQQKLNELKNASWEV